MNKSCQSSDWNGLCIDLAKENTMQLFPNTVSIESVSALGGVALKKVYDGVTGQANEFLNAFNEQLASSGITSVVDPEADQSLPAGFRVLRQDTGNRLNDEDIATINAGLKNRGVDDEQLAALENLMRSGQVPTLGNIIGALTGSRRITAALTDDERMQLGSALRKIGFTDDEAAGLEKLMDGGHGYEALQAVNMRLAKMEKGQTLTLDRSEMQSLIRGLELSDESSKKIAALFGKGESITADQAGMAALLAQANKDMAAKQENKKLLAKELQTAISDALKSKKLREATALTADTRGSKRSERAETRMLDDLTAKANGLGPEALADRIRKMAAENGESAEEGDTRHMKEQLAGKEAGTAAAARQAKTNAVPETGAGKNAEARTDPLSAMLGKVSLAGDMPLPATGAAQPQNASAAAGNYSREIYSQVEQGMLRGLSNGSRQITLRLDPVDLGQVTVLLTVKNGEVRALIRAENADATAALSEQMTQLRASLEEQGLKVAQLDVETQLPQDAFGKQWENAAQHNQEQEMREQARFMRLAQMRRGAGESLAQDMQSVDMREEFSATGLHIIA